MTHYNVKLHTSGTFLTELVTMIANHNGGISRIDMDIMCGFLMAKKAQIPQLYGNVSVTTDLEQANTIHVSDNNGESYYMSITEVELEELKPDFVSMDELVSQANEVLNSKI